MMMNTDTNNDTSPEWKKKKGFFPTIVAAVALVSVAGVSKYVSQPASLRISSPAMASIEVSENNDSLSFLDTLNLSGPRGNQVSHYWDCEQFACSAQDGNMKKTIFTCDRDGQNPHANCYGDYPENGSAACSSFVPIIEGSTLYGLAAINRGLSDAIGQCGNCYSMNVNNSGNNSVKKAVVMVTNTGDLDNGFAFDFLVPGGGFGEFAKNCDKMKGWNIEGVGCKGTKNTDTCTRYGGLHQKSQCGVAFYGDNQAKKACEDVLFNVFPDQQYEKFRNNLQISNIQSVTCPSQLTQKAETCDCGAFNCGAPEICGKPFTECNCPELKNVCPSNGGGGGGTCKGFCAVDTDNRNAGRHCAPGDMAGDCGGCDYCSPSCTPQGGDVYSSGTGDKIACCSGLVEVNENGVLRCRSSCTPQGGDMFYHPGQPDGKLACCPGFSENFEGSVYRCR